MHGGGGGGFPVDGAEKLALEGIRIDHSADNGGSGAHNTDAFEMGSSTVVTVTAANVKNQDKCSAVDSANVC